MKLDHLVIIGASTAGLLTAAASTGAFDRITIVERDELPEEPEARKGVPQGLQVHALLARGAEAMEQLLPGIIDELCGLGGVLLDAGAELATYGPEGWHGRCPSAARTVSMRRTHLERHLRRRVEALPNVDIRRGEAVGLVAASGVGNRISGVRLGCGEKIDATLVADASGRPSKSPTWLAEFGYPVVEEHELRSYIGYATVLVRIPADALPAGVKVMVCAPHPGNLHGCSIIPVGSGLHLLAALGMMKCYPPADRAGFLAHIRASSTQLIADIAEKSEFLSEIKTYRMPGSRRRLWENLDPHPDGFIAIGDAVMSFNPLYGQGMSVAAAEAWQLKEHLYDTDAPIPGLSRRVQQSMKPVVDAVFGVVRGIDCGYQDAVLLGIDRLSPDEMQFARALAQLATEDAEASLAVNYAVHFFDAAGMQTPSLLAKVADWMGNGRQPIFSDPFAVPDPIDLDVSDPRQALEPIGAPEK